MYRQIKSPRSDHSLVRPYHVLGDEMVPLEGLASHRVDKPLVIASPLVVCKRVRQLCVRVRGVAARETPREHLDVLQASVELSPCRADALVAGELEQGRSLISAVDNELVHVRIRDKPSSIISRGH